jgi:hypothetical protein
MQIKLTIRLVAALFALASFPAVALEMPADGTKNFSPPGDTPSYFANETAPESARLANPATFTREDVAAIPEGTEVIPAYSAGTETGRHGRHASAYRFAGTSRATHHATATSSKATSRSAHATTAHHGNAAAGASRSNPARHVKANIRQHAAAAPPTGLARMSVA